MVLIFIVICVIVGMIVAIKLEKKKKTRNNLYRNKNCDAF